QTAPSIRAPTGPVASWRARVTKRRAVATFHRARPPSVSQTTPADAGATVASTARRVAYRPVRMRGRTLTGARCCCQQFSHPVPPRPSASTGRCREIAHRRVRMHRPNVPAPRHAPCGRTRTAVQRLAILIVAFGLLSRASPAGAVSLPAGFQETVVQEGLSEPTAFRFAPDGRIFVAEKRGIVKVLHGFGDAHPALFADLRTSVHNYFDRGLLNLALHPDFPTRPWVYVLYVLDAPIGGTPPVYGTAGADSDGCDVPGGCVVADRVSRLDAAGDAMTGDEHVLVEDWCQWYPSHSGGGLVFGADGALYVSGGEGAT